MAKSFPILTLLICASAATAHAAKPPKELAIDLGGGVKLEMVLIPAGSFMMGDARGEYDERPVHKVNITKPFYLGKYEVTEEQWAAVTGTPHSKDAKDPKLPVTGLSWANCQPLLDKLNQRHGGKRDDSPGAFNLPTEAQWEYACRAGSTTRYHFGDDKKKLGEYAWYHDNSNGSKHPAGGKKPNAWGLYDMHGNVWELCRDAHYNHDYYAKSPTDDPPGPSEVLLKRDSRPIRGGGWNYTAWSCRSADRGYTTHPPRRNSQGFRVSRSVD